MANDQKRYSDEATEAWNILHRAVYNSALPMAKQDTILALAKQLREASRELGRAEGRESERQRWIRWESEGEC